jgi:phosphoribosyl 1,2-cyclic phosphate phosphodiesterase
MTTMNITFLGTGAAWGLPELNCHCLICGEMLRKGEKRQRPSLLLSGETRLLIDCGPDIRSQLSKNKVGRIDGILISHEHGDHYMGLDELFAYKRSVARKAYSPIPVYLTAKSWEVIGPRFGYLEEMEVIKTHKIGPGKWFSHGGFEVFPFKTYHGSFAKGSVGFIIKFMNQTGEEVRLAYTSDFSELPEVPFELLRPDYLVIQSFWLNEPVKNRPHHMSFQRAIHYIDRLQPKRETFLVHMGDTDMVAGDPANNMAKKYEPKDPLRPPSGGAPYPVPLNQAQWQKTVNQIMSERGLPYKVTVAYDDLCFRF